MEYEGEIYYQHHWKKPRKIKKTKIAKIFIKVNSLLVCDPSFKEVVDHDSP